MRELVSLLESDAELAEQMYVSLMRHERMGSTGIGRGIAIPYYRFEALSRPRLAFGRAPKGIDFKAIDGNPVYCFFMLLGPAFADPENLFLPLMGRLAQWFKTPGVTQRLCALETPEDLLRLLDEEGL